ncbi:PREDICTED: N6-adenosine-methyltransferase subunit METTL3-like [Branchiostoma belcheri]|uniref:mRNA m(6)A methyltransferase n=1 Tax=Branchiostoma belcheri TaxID=7741 RepID=A0A6P4YXM7_BRABE|nr:PREDICTED: N6-adenosine-methyltransferase subunit METTL3-like [Branchiostoma belcheri]
MSDTWSSIQAHRKSQESLRERLQRRRRQGLGLDIEGLVAGSSSDSKPSSRSSTPHPHAAGPTPKADDVTNIDPDVEKKLLACLNEQDMTVPTDSTVLQGRVAKDLEKDVSQACVESLLQKFAAQELIVIKNSVTDAGTSCIVVTELDHSKLKAMCNELLQSGAEVSEKSGVGVKRKRETDSPAPEERVTKAVSKKKEDLGDDSIESLLSMPTIKEQETKEMGEEIFDLLSKPTAKEQSLVEKFKSQGGAQVQEFCPHGTKEECRKERRENHACNRLHFKKIIKDHTDESLGDCSFLNTCFHMDTCKYVHYEIEFPEGDAKLDQEQKAALAKAVKPKNSAHILYPSQWVQCDIRRIDMEVLGKFSVVMADPPWDIHMDLPYGTMTDDEMRNLNVSAIQDEGYIFLWVTGRAMELGRECLKLWGYERVDELIWVKTNQLQRIIRTGRTGHWLNHGKEHCLVGAKGTPFWTNRGLDADVIVAEVRETSHKPDEVYGIIERLAPGRRKIELFGRMHNVQPNWVTLGNQLDGVHLVDPEMVDRFRQRYPDGDRSYLKPS